MSTFWDDMNEVFASESAIDRHLQGREIQGSQTHSLRDLTDAARAAKALPLPQPAGTRVRFVANLGAVLTYSDMPDPDSEGIVVTVRSGSGDVTALDGQAFVLWDDGKFRPILAEHLRLSSKASRQARSVRVVVSDLGDLSSFFTAAQNSSDDLVHKATKDLWAVKKQGDDFVVERLFSETGQPLKV